MNICIFGASSSHLDPVYYESAESLGKLIAQDGHTLIFGAGADGLMGACARGAKNHGGRVVGIAPRFFNEPGFLLPDCDRLILTDTMNERKEKMLENSDAFIVLPGGIGTLDEFSEVITLKQLGRIQGPLVLLNTAGFYESLLTMLQQMADLGFMSQNCLRLLRVCSDPEDALSAALTPDETAGSIRRLEDYTR